MGVVRSGRDAKLAFSAVGESLSASRRRWGEPAYPAAPVCAQPVLWGGTVVAQIVAARMSAYGVPYCMNCMPCLASGWRT